MEFYQKESISIFFNSFWMSKAILMPKAYSIFKEPLHAYLEKNKEKSTYQQ